MSDHARLSPSNKRWPHCPGSVREEAKYPDTPGRSAIDGTGTHLLLEKCLDDNASPYDFEQQVIGPGHEDMPLGWIVERDRCDRVQMALDYIDRRRWELDAEYPDCVIEVWSESTSYPGARFSPPREDWWGTCDITITVTRGDGYLAYLEVADYKDGRGWVPAEDNTQLQSYAAGKLPVGAIAMSTVQNVRVTIIQPRTTPVIRYADYTAPEIHQVAVDLHVSAGYTDDPNASLAAGWWCQWCKANPKRGGHCTQPAQQATQEVQGMSDFDKLLDIDVNNASESELAEVAGLEPQILRIQEALDRVKAEIHNRLEQELPVSGWELRPGRKKRDWSDEDEVLKALKTTSLKVDEYAPRKLISPAQAEKVVSSRTMEGKLRGLIEETPGKKKPQRVAQDKPKDADTMFSNAISFK